jgi:hypothetical protein
MPRSFLVKKVKSDEDRHPNQYRIRDVFEESVASLKAATPFTPVLQPLSVRISNGNYVTFVLVFIFHAGEKHRKGEGENESSVYTLTTFSSYPW